MMAKPEVKERENVSGRIIRDKVIVNRSGDSKDAVDLFYSRHNFGKLEEKSLSLSLVEALYLVEKEKLVVTNSRIKELTYDSFVRAALRVDKKFLSRYVVFKDLRTRGYNLRAALKYGADFLVYDRGRKPGEDHSKWLLFVVSESDKFSWRSWVGSNRVAHSVKKKALIGIVDDNFDVTYYEVSWRRP